MKIAISSEGESRTSRVDARFGRARWILIYDTASGRLEAIGNSRQQDLPQGAGIQVARTVIDGEADVLLTGHCGPKAFQTLAAAGVKVVIGLDGTVEEALGRFERGELRPTETSDVMGHW